MKAPNPVTEENPMKTGFVGAVRWSVVLASVFAPFLVLLAALLLLPRGIYIGKAVDSLDWMWLILLAAMIMGIYSLTVYIAFRAFAYAKRAR